MMDFEYDEQIEKKVANTFNNDNEFYIAESKFLPMLEFIISDTEEALQTFDLQ